MMRSILILAAHPDDEVLGCGGTIAKLSDEGAIVRVAFLADGVSSRVGAQATMQFELSCIDKQMPRAIARLVQCRLNCDERRNRMKSLGKYIK